MESFESFYFDQQVKSYEEFLFVGNYGFSILQLTLKSFILLNFQYFLKKIKS